MNEGANGYKPSILNVSMCPGTIFMHIMYFESEEQERERDGLMLIPFSLPASYFLSSWVQCSYIDLAVHPTEPPWGSSAHFS